MNMPFALPDWVPWWVPLVLLVPALLYVLVFLFMPFSVLGVKTRLEAIEVRLDELQHELRHIALRLPVGSREMDFEEVYAPMSQSSRRVEPMNDRPPIPPATHDLYEDEEAAGQNPPPPNARPGRRQDTATPRSERSEPRLDRRR